MPSPTLRRLIDKVSNAHQWYPIESPPACQCGFSAALTPAEPATGGDHSCNTSDLARQDCPQCEAEDATLKAVMRTPGPAGEVTDGERLVTVCDKCLRACCWQGEFMCDDNKRAGTLHKTFRELAEAGLESSDWWF